MHVLLDTLNELLDAADLATISGVVSWAARRLVDADGATVVLRCGSDCQYVGEDADSALWRGRAFPAHICVSGLAMRSGQPVVIPDIHTDARVPRDLYDGTFVQGLALVPDGPPAPSLAIGAYWAQPHQADANEIDLLRRLARAAGRAVARQRVQQQLAESERRFRSVADSTPVLIWMRDASGRLEFVNRAWMDFVGTTDADDSADAWQALLHPHDRDAYVAALLDCLRTATPFTGEVRVRHASGEWRWVASYGAPRLDADGRCQGMVGSSVDITELKTAVVQAARDAQQKEQWLAVVGHELRQPVHTVKAALALLDEAADPVSAARARTTMDRQLAQMGRLLDDLLDTARLIRGDVTLTPTVLDVRAVVDEAVEAIHADLLGRDQHVTVGAPATPVLVRADAGRLQQVLTNLLVNASKYSAAGQAIVVTVRLVDMVEVAVVDHGQGIDAALLPQIFDLFTTVGGPRGSHGIGLAVARRLTELHGGTLHAHSDGRGRGSQFLLRLPPLLPPDERSRA